MIWALGFSLEGFVVDYVAAPPLHHLSMLFLLPLLYRVIIGPNSLHFSGCYEHRVFVFTSLKPCRSDTKQVVVILSELTIITPALSRLRQLIWIDPVPCPASLLARIAYHLVAAIRIRNTLTGLLGAGGG